MTQKRVSGMSSYGPPRNYCGALEVDLKTCAKGTKLRVYNTYCKSRKLKEIIKRNKTLAESEEYPLLKELEKNPKIN